MLLLRDMPITKRKEPQNKLQKLIINLVQCKVSAAGGNTNHISLVNVEVMPQPEQNNASQSQQNYKSLS